MKNGAWRDYVIVGHWRATDYDGFVWQHPIYVNDVAAFRASIAVLSQTGDEK